MEVTFIIEPFPLASAEANPLLNFNGTKKLSSNEKLSFCYSLDTVWIFFGVTFEMLRTDV